MTSRIPSSLNWLVTKRSRLAGEIKKAEATLPKRIELAKAHIESLKADLAVIDQTIRLHEIQLNPNLIPPIKTQATGRSFGHGAMTRAIFACLRAAANEPRSTTEVALYVSLHAKVEMTTENLAEIRYSIRKRLAALAGQGKIEIVRRAKTSVEGYWRIKNWVAPAPIGRPKKSSL